MRGALVAESMSDDELPAEQPLEDVVTEENEVVEQEPKELTLEEKLAEAMAATEIAEKEISYRDADISNLRKRHAQDRTELLKYGSQNLARRLVEIIDNFDRAISSMPDSTDEAVMEGIIMTKNNIINALKSEGATEIIAEGMSFDPKNMEAITTIPPSEEFPPGMVVQILDNGWMIHDRVLRPARVVVTAVE